MNASATNIEIMRRGRSLTTKTMAILPLLLVVIAITGGCQRERSEFAKASVGQRFDTEIGSTVYGFFEDNEGDVRLAYVFWGATDFVPPSIQRHEGPRNFNLVINGKSMGFPETSSPLLVSNDANGNLVKGVVKSQYLCDLARKLPGTDELVDDKWFERIPWLSGPKLFRKHNENVE